MTLIITVLAFALLMGVNLYVLLYQQWVVQLLAYLRSNFPLVYKRLKSRLFLTIVMTDRQTRAILQRANDNQSFEDRMVQETLEELTALRQRALGVFAPLTALLLVLVIMVIW